MLDWQDPILPVINLTLHAVFQDGKEVVGRKPHCQLHRQYLIVGLCDQYSLIKSAQRLG